MTRADGLAPLADVMVPELFPVKRLAWETSDTFTC